MCRRYGATGPVARGSGINYDVRKNEPYSVYPEFDFEVPVFPRAIPWPATWCAWTRWSRDAHHRAGPGQAARRAGDGQGSQDPQAGCKGDYYHAVETARRFAGAPAWSAMGQDSLSAEAAFSPTFSNLSLFGEACQGMLLPTPWR
jgi:NADH-quinone oxidoreductase subunit D